MAIVHNLLTSQARTIACYLMSGSATGYMHGPGAVFQLRMKDSSAVSKKVRYSLNGNHIQK